MIGIIYGLGAFAALALAYSAMSNGTVKTSTSTSTPKSGIKACGSTPASDVEAATVLQDFGGALRVRSFNETNKIAIWKNLRSHYFVQDKSDPSLARLGVDQTGAAVDLDKTAEAWALAHADQYVLAPLCLAFNTSDARFLRAVHDPSILAADGGIYAILAEPGEGVLIATKASGPDVTAPPSGIPGGGVSLTPSPSPSETLDTGSKGSTPLPSPAQLCSLKITPAPGYSLPRFNPSFSAPAGVGVVTLSPALETIVRRVITTFDNPPGFSRPLSSSEGRRYLSGLLCFLSSNPADGPALRANQVENLAQQIERIQGNRDASNAVVSTLQGPYSHYLPRLRQVASFLEG